MLLFKYSLSNNLKFIELSSFYINFFNVRMREIKIYCEKVQNIPGFDINRLVTLFNIYSIFYFTFRLFTSKQS